MQLDRIAIALRRRNAWQAVDLGFAVARRWWLPLWLAWTVPALLLYAPLALLLPQDQLWIGATLVWWLKPLWDGAPLFIASRRLFGEPAGLREAWAQTPRLFGRELVAWLLWRRLSLTRSADLPITLLERLRGAERRRRLLVLHPGMGNAAGWLTAGCVHFEGILIFGMWGLAALMIPEDLGFDAVDFYREESVLSVHLHSLLAFAAMTLVAPAYTMAGFMLYICRRVELEGWDIEIRFRALAARQSTAAAPGTRTAALAVLLLSGLLAGLASDSGHAAPGPAPAAAAAAGDERGADPETDLDRVAASARIRQVLDGPEFHERTEIRKLRSKVPDEGDGSGLDWLERLREWLRGLGEGRHAEEASGGIGFAEIAEFLLWLTAGGLVAFVLYRLRHLLPRLDAMNRASAPPPPQVMFGLDLRPDSLPPDIPAAVQALWQSGQVRAAMSLLYRATLARLLSDHALPFADHHTEGECAALVREGCPQLADFFGELTAVWQRLAYAHLPPAEAQLAGLCRRWQEAFAHEA